MLGKRSRPAIGKLAGVLRSGIVDTITSPRSPLDCRALQGLKSNNYYYDQQHGGIGLGIIVALDNKSSNCNVGFGGEILAKYAICSQFSSRSNPINVTPSSKIKNHQNGTMLRYENEEQKIEELEEEFTYVTCRGTNKSTTRVYYSGDEFDRHQSIVVPKIISKKIGVFNICSPARFSDDCRDLDSDSDFLNSCHLCKKGLQGKDIFMYRGEKAFCSTECRRKHIRIDERKERCRSEASRSGELSSSPYSYTSRGQIFSTGIVAV